MEVGRLEDFSISLVIRCWWSQHSCSEMRTKMTIGGWRWHHLIRKSLCPELKNPKTKGCQQSRRNLIKGTTFLPPAGNSFDWETIPDCTGAKYKTFAAAYFKHCECLSTTFSVKVTQKSLTKLLQMAQSGLNVAFYYISSYFFNFFQKFIQRISNDLKFHSRVFYHNSIFVGLSADLTCSHSWQPFWALRNFRTWAFLLFHLSERDDRVGTFILTILTKYFFFFLHQYLYFHMSRECEYLWHLCWCYCDVQMFTVKREVGHPTPNAHGKTREHVENNNTHLMHPATQVAPEPAGSLNAVGCLVATGTLTHISDLIDSELLLWPRCHQRSWPLRRASQLTLPFGMASTLGLLMQRSESVKPWHWPDPLCGRSNGERTDLQWNKVRNIKQYDPFFDLKKMQSHFSSV